MYVLTHDALTNCQPERLPRKPVVSALLRTFQLWHARAQERRAFSVVDERDLRDLGLSRYDVQRELAKPFWRG